MTLTLLLKILEIAPTVITEAKADIAKLMADTTVQQQVGDAIKAAEDALDEVKALIAD